MDHTCDGACPLALYASHESPAVMRYEILLDLLSADMFSVSSISDTMQLFHWLKGVSLDAISLL